MDFKDAHGIGFLNIALLQLQQHKQTHQARVLVISGGTGSSASVNGSMLYLS